MYKDEPHPIEAMQDVDEWTRVRVGGQEFDVHFHHDDEGGPTTISMYPLRRIGREGVTLYSVTDTQRWVSFAQQGTEGKADEQEQRAHSEAQ